MRTDGRTDSSFNKFSTEMRKTLNMSVQGIGFEGVGWIELAQNVLQWWLL
jgi:hypothetical protein